MVVSEDNILERGTSFGDKVSEGEPVIGGVNNVGLTLGFNIIGEDSEHFGFELSHIDSVLSVF